MQGVEEERKVSRGLREYRYRWECGICAINRTGGRTLK
jgi:hypothetical protein